jgi:nucleotide-binding universal stress UspA family protein
MTPSLSPSQHFTVVVGDDFEPASAHAFDLAVDLVVRVPRSRLHVVHVVREGTSETDVHRFAAMLRVYIEEKCLAASRPDQFVGVHVRVGEPAHEITQVATEVAANLILVGASTRTRVRGLLQGSLGGRLARGAPCPVLVAEPGRERTAVADGASTSSIDHRP